MIQAGEREARPGTTSPHDGRGPATGAETESEARHQQSVEGQIQVPAEILSPRSILPGN